MAGRPASPCAGFGTRDVGRRRYYTNPDVRKKANGSFFIIYTDSLLLTRLGAVNKHCQLDCQRHEYLSRLLIYRNGMSNGPRLQTHPRVETYVAIFDLT